jgi:hypothetical protein
MRNIRPGDLCLVLPPAWSAGKSVTAIKRCAPASYARPDTPWLVDPPILRRIIRPDGTHGPFRESHFIEEELLMPIRPEPDPEEVDAEEATPASANRLAAWQ